MPDPTPNAQTVASLPPPLTGTEDLPDLVGRALRAAVPPLHRLVSRYADLREEHVGTWREAVDAEFFNWRGVKTDPSGSRDHDHDPYILLKWILETWRDGPWQKQLAPQAGKSEVDRVFNLRNQHAHNRYDHSQHPLDAGDVRDGLMALETILSALKAEPERTYVDSLSVEAATRANNMTKRKLWKNLRKDRYPEQVHTVGLHWTEPDDETLRPDRIWLVHFEPDGKLNCPSGTMSVDDALDYLERFAAQDQAVLLGCAFCFSVPAWLITAVSQASQASGLDAVEIAWNICEQAGVKVSSVRELIGELNTGFGATAGPFWRGGANEPDPNGSAKQETMRQTEKAVAESTGAQPSSVFRVGGDASVGALAVEGMPLLPHLRAAGYRIWPFEQPGARTVVEVFPRSLWAATQYDRPVHSLPIDRERFVKERDYGGGGRTKERLMQERRAFDALMTAWALREYGGNVHRLPWGTGLSAVEGQIWLPTPHSER